MKKSLLSLSVLALSLSQFAYAERFIVDQYADTGAKGSLRWAIEQANSQPLNASQLNTSNNSATAGHETAHEIVIQAVGKPPYVIKANKPLPEIKVPVSIVGAAWAVSGEHIAIDGSNYIKGTGVEACPGAVPGQYGTNVRTTTLPGLVLRDTQNVSIQGIEVRNFCIGILVNRTSNSLIQHNRIMNNYGGAGIMLTGDDGKGGSTSTTTNNNKILNNYLQDNGDGLELTRGAAFNLVANNQFISTAVNPEPSQGIEILWGNDNAVVGNIFKNYSDGLQINWGKRNYIGYNELSGNSIGFNLTGDGNILDSNRVHNNRIGVAIRSEKDANAHIRLTKNLIWNNGQEIKRCEAGGSCVPDQTTGAIVMNVPALEHAEFVGSRGYGVVMDAASMQHTCQDKPELALKSTTQNAAQSHCNARANQNIPTPVLSLHKGRIQISVQGAANTRYQIELFGNQNARSTEAERYLGSTAISTDAKGRGQIVWDRTETVATVTATLTNPQGATSALSPALTF
ncbi:3-dehydroshikimate dehydratase [Acinetobacter calcoaceticus]|uniref:3-dehydroshikimate dehydratase n=1 Tax=Acinetobacter calcoaceticus TaxID=471 RepID=A0A4R1XI08_ACICA|nr:3-dehydroshikimate dehydratase [Acinetobacter calcoaceticus]